MKDKLRLLIVEDEEPICRGLIDVFVFHGYEVDSALDGRSGLEKAISGTYDLILLDVMLPELDGFSVCNEIRKVNRDQPIIMLTAKTSDEDIISGLTLGADDYIGKPFSIRQLVLRVEAVLRRSQKLKLKEREFRIGAEASIDTVTLEGRGFGPDPLLFTRREVEILQYLSLHSDRPVSREELLEQVWGYSAASQIETRTVDIHIAKLRRKIEQQPKNPAYLKTIRGEGYRFFVEGSGHL